MIALTASLSTCGCSSIWHSFSEVTFQGVAEVSREKMEESWGEVKELRHRVSPGYAAVRIRLTVVQQGTVSERIVSGDVIRRSCIRHHGGWSLNGLGLPTPNGGESKLSAEAIGILGAAVLGVGVLVCDGILFIPWWLSGHTWLNACGHSSDAVRNPRSEIVTRAVEREAPLSRGTVEFRMEGVLVGDRVTNSRGDVELSFVEVIQFSKGRSGNLELRPEFSASALPVLLSPTSLLTLPWGTAPDWSVVDAAAPHHQPSLTVQVREEPRCLRIRIRNRGSGDACQVACAVGGTGSKSDRRCAIFGRIRAGADAEATIWLSRPGLSGRIEFFETRDRIPEPVKFGKRP